MKEFLDTVKAMLIKYQSGWSADFTRGFSYSIKLLEEVHKRTPVYNVNVRLSELEKAIEASEAKVAKQTKVIEKLWATRNPDADLSLTEKQEYKLKIQHLESKLAEKNQIIAFHKNGTLPEVKVSKQYEPAYEEIINKLKEKNDYLSSCIHDELYKNSKFQILDKQYNVRVKQVNDLITLLKLKDPTFSKKAFNAHYEKELKEAFKTDDL